MHMEKTTLYLVRHGETEENKLRILQGHMPGHLSEERYAQARQLAGQLDSLSLQHIYCSDLQRCRDTAAILNEHLSLPVSYTPLLRERDWGPSTGVSLLKQRIPVSPDAESIDAMIARVRTFLHQLLTEHPGQRLLVVSHGLILRMLIAYARQCSYKQIAPLANAEMRELVLHGLPGMPGYRNPVEYDEGATDC